jgi:hypothetical protein
MNIRGLVFGACAALSLAAAAQAGTVTFNFAGATSSGPNAGGWSDVLTYTEDGITLAVSGGPVANNKTAWVKTWYNAGLGVCSGYEQPSCVTGDHQLDSFGVDEFVYLAFDKAVSLSQIAFNYLNNNDTFDLAVDGTQVIDNGALADNVFSSFVNFDPAYNGSIFAIAAGVSTKTVCQWSSYGKKCWTEDVNSAFKIKSVTVSNVPLPATGLLLVGGLGLLAAARRRRAAA